MTGRRETKQESLMLCACALCLCLMLSDGSSKAGNLHRREADAASRDVGRVAAWRIRQADPSGRSRVSGGDG